MVTMTVLDLLYVPIRICETCYRKIDRNRCPTSEGHDVAEFGEIGGVVERIGTRRSLGRFRVFDRVRAP